MIFLNSTHASIGGLAFILISKQLENTRLCHIKRHALLGSHFLPLIFQIQKETKENLGIGYLN